MGRSRDRRPTAVRETEACRRPANGRVRSPVLRRVSAALIVGAAALTAGTAPAAARSIRGPAGPRFLQPCGGSSWVAGSTDLCHGAVVYRDYVYDDEGADTGGLGYDSTQSAFGSLAPPAGDLRYPAGDISSADLVQLKLWRVGARIRVLALLNALWHPRSTILAIAVDTDNNRVTGGGSWRNLGIRSRGWDKLYEFTAGSVKTDTIQGSFPLPRSRRWRVQAVTAQASSNTVMNVAFRSIDEQAAYKADYANPSPFPPSGQGSWFEDNQAAALRAGDISQFGYAIDTADLRPRVTRLQSVGPGLHERVYTSRYTLPPGKGMSYAGISGRGTGGALPGAFSQVFNFLGRYQPYGIYIPSRPGPYGLQMEWHGSNQGIVGQINQPGMQHDFGANLNRILVVPEARGPNGYGSDISERDLLDVMNDVQAHYPVDRTRVFSSGYSQGGYITFRMAMLYPDRFAGFTSWVGFTGDDTNGTPLQGSVGITAGAVGNMIDFVGNLRHVPGAMLYSAQDELVQVPSSTAMQRAFDTTDDVYVWYMHNPADHFTYALLDNWQKEAAYSAGQRLVVDPVRITFRYDPALDSSRYAIHHNRAYWLSRIEPRASGSADTDLSNYACGGSFPATSTGTGAGPQPVPWISDYRQQTGVTPVARRSMIEGSLRNVASLQIDNAATCTTGRTVAYRIATDGTTSIRFSDGRSLTLDGGGTHTGVLAR